MNAQPILIDCAHGQIALCHNGNLVNAPALSEELFQDDLRQINTGSDSEVLLNVFAHELMEFVRGGDAVLQTQNVFDAVRRLHERCQGAYAVVVMIVGYGLVAFRDPYGIRPLVLGERADAQGRSLMAASESVALDVLGYQPLGDIAPGEAVVIKPDGAIERQICASQTELAPCLFEYVYLARPDSIMDDVAVYKSRLRMGEKLAEHIHGRHLHRPMGLCRKKAQARKRAHLGKTQTDRFQLPPYRGEFNQRATVLAYTAYTVVV